MKKLAIFASGGGSNAEQILQYFDQHESVEIALIISNKPDAGVITRAYNWKIPALVLGKKQYRDGAFLCKLMQQWEISHIALAGYLKLIPTSLIQAFPNKIFNIHPALLPKFGGKGMYGMNVHRAVIAAGESHSGMTIHYVDEQYDEGKIIFQDQVRIEKDWDAQKLQQEVLKLEHAHYPRIIANQLL